MNFYSPIKEETENTNWYTSKYTRQGKGENIELSLVVLNHLSSSMKKNIVFHKSIKGKFCIIVQTLVFEDGASSCVKINGVSHMLLYNTISMCGKQYSKGKSRNKRAKTS